MSWKQPQEKQTGELLATIPTIHTHMDCLIMYLYNGGVLKSCAYKTFSFKFNHKHHASMYVYVAGMKQALKHLHLQISI